MTLLPVSTNDPHVAAHNEERDAINELQDDLGTKLDLPSNPLTGEMLRYDGLKWARTTARYFEGEGSPEGVIAAPVGSRYVDKNATGGAIEWIKRFGLATSNTGWILSAYSDTGWRNVLGMLQKPSGSVGYTAMIRRVGMMVDAYFDLETPNANGNWDFLTLPDGFRPTFSRYGALQDNKENAATSTYVSAAGLCRLTTIKGSWRDRFNGTWMTTDNWPAVLPGVAG
jgi:hypothetical protein